MQILEREPMLDSKSSKLDGDDKKSAPTKRMNAHKYLLFKPTLPQLLFYLSAAFKELNEDSGLLLYLSADGLSADSGSSLAETKVSVLDCKSNFLIFSFLIRILIYANIYMNMNSL